MQPTIPGRATTGWSRRESNRVLDASGGSRPGAVIPSRSSGLNTRVGACSRKRCKGFKRFSLVRSSSLFPVCGCKESGIMQGVICPICVVRHYFQFAAARNQESCKVLCT